MVQVFVLPVVNPDGYEYSRQHDRMWRKTRSRTGGRNLFGDVSAVHLKSHFLSTFDKEKAIV